MINEVLEDLRVRKERVESGIPNLIPSPFTRFSSEFVGIEQAVYYLVTASTKVGKTQIADFMFLYAPFFYAFNNRERIRLKIFYFSLEMSKQQKIRQFLCHLLFVLSRGKVRVDPKELRSSREAISDEILNMLNQEEYIEYYKFFEENVIFIDDVRNPYGIYTVIRDYANSKGTIYKRKIKIRDKVTGELQEIEINDYYVADDPDEYVICIVDHISLITPERGNDLRQSMSDLSSKYLVPLRNLYRIIPVVIQQQTMTQEGVENFKLNRVKPSLDGLGEAKTTARDADAILGLYSPMRHNIPEYEGYNIKEWKDNIRFLELIVGREGGGGTIVPLFFDGGVNFFKELPLPNDSVGMATAKKLLNRVRSGVQLSFFLYQDKNKEEEKKKKKKLKFLKWVKL